MMKTTMTNLIFSSFVFRFPEHIHFHFFVPEHEDERSSYYKLKVLLPHSNLDITG